MTITGGTSLAGDEIDRMIKDAEAYAEEDRRKRESVELRNRAEQLVNQTEKLVEEQGEQMTEDEKTAVEAAVADLRTTLEAEGGAGDEIQAKMDALITASQAMAQRLYAQAASEQPAPDGAETSDDDVVEAEIIDEGDDQT